MSEASNPLRPEGPPRVPGQRAVRPKAAATVLILRRDGPKPRLLMGRRHAGHSFMPERWVFPGGRVDRGDWNAPAATELAPETQAVFDGRVKPGLARAAALAAVRETWEETGLLLARPAPPRPGAGPWREFLAAGALPDLSALSVLGRAITPPVIAKRFDTWAFLADAERLMTLERQPDCGELDEIAWLEFDQALELKLPTATRVFVKEAAARLTEAGRPHPFVHFRQGAVRVGALEH
jgi:8-oxo-dGTP pyrophosphatase MutT (NUDIX family)